MHRMHAGRRHLKTGSAAGLRVDSIFERKLPVRCDPHERKPSVNALAISTEKTGAELPLIR